MPQPIRQKCHLEFSGLSQRPQHAMALGRIIAISGILETRLGWILAFMSRGSATITVSMFHAVASTDAQRAMLMAAAEQALGISELETFKELMEDFRPRYGERSKLVHNIWGHSNDHPGMAIWCRSSEAAKEITKYATASTPEARIELAESDSLVLRCMAYTVKDLDDVAGRLQEYTNRVGDFFMQLWQHHPALAASTSAATNAPRTSEEPQLNLPQPDQTAPQSGPLEDAQPDLGKSE